VAAAVQLAMDTARSDMRAMEFTPSRDGDSPVLADLLGQIPEDEQIGAVTPDGAYDTRRCHTAIIEHDAVPFGHSFGPRMDGSHGARVFRLKLA
jgi:hypothetical protein